jgi:hypothetical protein
MYASPIQPFPNMFTRLVIFSFAALFVCPATEADQWYFEKEVVEDSFEFGETTIVRTRDSTTNQLWPEYSIAIYQGDELMAKYKGVSFEFIFASEDNTDFIGLSNSGLPGTAFVWFRSSGTLNILMNHGHFEPDYCAKSVTINRHWLDRKNPDLRFEYETVDWGDGHVEKVIEQISFIDCRGDRVNWASVYFEGIIRLAEQYQQMRLGTESVPEAPSSGEND